LQLRTCALGNRCRGGSSFPSLCGHVLPVPIRRVSEDWIPQQALEYLSGVREKCAAKDVPYETSYCRHYEPLRVRGETPDFHRQCHNPVHQRGRSESGLNEQKAAALIGQDVTGYQKRSLTMPFIINVCKDFPDESLS